MTGRETQRAADRAAHHLHGIRAAAEQLAAQARRIADHLTPEPAPAAPKYTDRPPDPPALAAQTPRADTHRRRQWLHDLDHVAELDDHTADEIVTTLMRRADTEQARALRDHPALDWWWNAHQRANDAESRTADEDVRHWQAITDLLDLLGDTQTTTDTQPERPRP